MIAEFNYHHLYYFKVIAEEGSVSKAAEKLLLGQPTLSAQLKQLEDQLQIQLFERRHKKLILTEEGQVTLEYAKSIFKMGTELFEVLHDKHSPLKPSLHIGALDSVPKQIVVHLSKLVLKHGPCHLTLSEGPLEELLVNLKSHHMDIVLTNYLPKGEAAKGLLTKLLSKKNVSFYASSRYKNLRSGFPNSLSGVPLILPTFDSQLRQDIELWFKMRKLELNIIAESQDISVKKLMAIEGLGVIPTAPYSVAYQTFRGELIELGKLQHVHEELYLITAQRKLENTLAIFAREHFDV